MASRVNCWYCYFLCSLILTLVFKSTALVRFTNVRCKTYNPNFTQFEYCRIRALSRHVQGVYLKVNLAQTAKDAVIAMQFKKKTNGYNNFRREIKFDACDFLAHNNNLIIMSIFKVWSKFSNMNHTCPYAHDLIVENMQLEDTILSWIPYPAGEYAFFSTWYLNGAKAMQMDFYFSYK